MPWRSTACFPGWPVWEVMVDDVQRTTPGTSGSVGERRDGRRVAAVNDDGGSGGGGRGGGIILILWLAALWGGGPNDKNLSPTSSNIVFLCTKSHAFHPRLPPKQIGANTWNEKIVSSAGVTLDFIISLLLSAPER